jgi:DNA-binding NtrC family response regulator
MKVPRILIVEDNRALSMALAAAVSQCGATSEVVATAMQAQEQLRKSSFPYSAMILDIGLPDRNGLEFFRDLPREIRPPTLIITAHGELENTILARKLGVREFLNKPIEFEALKEFLNRLIADSKGSKEHREPSSAYIGAAPSMRIVFQQIAHACASNEPVLITGETGTGKSTTADLISRNSQTKQDTKVLFRPGTGDQLEALQAVLEQAGGGVLILDKLRDLEKKAQAELVHQWEKERDDFPRIIAISDLDLRNATQNGAFRNDLFYRLQVLEIRLPKLQERMDDLPALFSFFLAQAQPGRSIAVDEESLDRMQAHHWSGNLLELRNVASYAITACSSGNLIQPRHLPEYLVNSVSSENQTLKDSLEKALEEWIEASGELNSYQQLAEELEARLIRQLLGKFDGKLARMANTMQANRTTLRKKLRNLRSGS